MSNIQLLLLAAGGSTRMKEPKQLLSWGGTTLIEHQIRTLLNTHKSLSVVVGAHTERIMPIIDSLPIKIVHNEYWYDGMGTSIAIGVRKVFEENPDLNGILISLIDQPLLTTAHFNKMLQLFRPGNMEIIVSTAEGHWSGAPVLFDKVYVDELIKLKGDEGAKIVTNKYKNFVKSVEGGGKLIDVDTPESYQKVLKKFMKKN